MLSGSVSAAHSLTPIKAAGIQIALARSGAVRAGKWKAVKGRDEAIELFNLEKDSGETEGIADQHPQIVEQMKERMKQAWTGRRDYNIRSGPGRSDYVR